MSGWTLKAADHWSACVCQRLMDDMIGKLAWEGLQKNIMMDGDMIIDKRAGRHGVGSLSWFDILERQVLGQFCSLYRP